MTEAEQRAAVVAEALTWVGTAYHHGAKLKARRDATGKIVDKGGVDCAMILYQVYHSVGLVPEFQVEHYPRDWHMHRDDERFMEHVLRYAHPIESPQPGDVVLYREGRSFAHGGIIVDPGWPWIVHADFKGGFVDRARGDRAKLEKRAHKFFTCW